MSPRARRRLQRERAAPPLGGALALSHKLWNRLGALTSRRARFALSATFVAGEELGEVISRPGPRNALEWFLATTEEDIL